MRRYATLRALLSSLVFTTSFSLSFVHRTALAGPEGGEVVGGDGTITYEDDTTTILQESDSLAIDWDSFDVDADERVHFIQPDSDSVALNNILSNHGSTINGQIDANGHVFLINPNGVIFGEGAVINAGGILASGLRIDPQDFMNGDYIFSAVDESNGFVLNQGLINAAMGGSVALIGAQVENEGVISAQLGSVTLAAGNEAVVTFDQSGLLGVTITETVLQDDIGVDAAVINSGEISAESGQVLLTAAVSQDIFSSAVNAGELRHATSVVVDEDGSFTLSAGADVVNSGVVSTSGDSAGDIVVIGDNVTNSGSIISNSDSGSGGAIELNSMTTTEVVENGVVSANGSVGGDVKVLGTNVGLLGDSVVEANGVSGGGQVLVGGDESGWSDQVNNAEFVYLGAGSRVSADGLVAGNGGRVITFANDTLRAYGELTARGGFESGFGGFVETSGLKSFEIFTVPEVTAAEGGGHWLIDPYDITISSSVDTGDGLDRVIPPNDPERLYQSSDSDGDISWAFIEIFLDGSLTYSTGRTITIQTTAGDGSELELGNINFEAGTAELHDGTGFSGSVGQLNSTLILDAHNDIIFNNQSLSVSAGGDLLDNDQLNLTLDAGGDIRLEGTTNINLSGGTFSAEAGGSFTLSDTSQIITEGGGVSIDAVGAITIDSTTTYTAVDDGEGNPSYPIEAIIDTGGGAFYANAGTTFTLGTTLVGWDAAAAIGESVTLSQISTGGGTFEVYAPTSVNIYGEVVVSGSSTNDVFNQGIIIGGENDDSDTVIPATVNIGFQDDATGTRTGYLYTLFDSVEIEGTAVNILGEIRTISGDVNVGQDGADTSTTTVVSYRAEDTDLSLVETFGSIDTASINDSAGDINIRATGTVTLGNITVSEDRNTTTPGSDLVTVAVNATEINVQGTITYDSDEIENEANRSTTLDFDVSGVNGIRINEGALITYDELNSVSGELNFDFDGTALTVDAAVADIKTRGGDINVGVTSGISTGALNTSGVLAEDGGYIVLNSTAGAVTAGTLTTSSGGIVDDDTDRPGSTSLETYTSGLVNIDAATGIDIDSIITSGANGNDTANQDCSSCYTGAAGGNAGIVTVDTVAGNINVGVIAANGGNASVESGGGNDVAPGGNAATITLTAPGVIYLEGNVSARGGLLADENTTASNDFAQNGDGADITFNGNTILSTNIEIRSDLAGMPQYQNEAHNNDAIVTTLGDVAFNGTLNADADVVGDETFSAYGNSLTIQEEIGGVTTLGGITIDVESVVEIGTPPGDSFVGADISTLYIDSTSASFDSGAITVFGDQGADYEVDITSESGDITIGNIVTTGTVTSDVANVTGTLSGSVQLVSSAAVNTGSITTTGVDATSLNGAVTETVQAGSAGAVIVTGTTDLILGSISANAGGAIDGDEVDPNFEDALNDGSAADIVIVGGTVATTAIQGNNVTIDGSTITISGDIGTSSNYIGALDITDTTGAIALGENDIYATSVDLRSTSFAGDAITTSGGVDEDGGTVSIEATNGAGASISVGDINTSGGITTTVNGRDGGAVTLTSASTLEVGSVTTDGGDAASLVSSVETVVAGAGAAITINSSTINVTGTLSAQGGNATDGDAVTTDADSLTGGAGGLIDIDGDNITLAALNTSGGDATIADGNAANTFGGAGADIDVNADEDNSAVSITLNGDVNAEGGAGATVGSAAAMIDFEVDGNNTTGQIQLNLGSVFYTSEITLDGRTSDGDTLIGPSRDETTYWVSDANNDGNLYRSVDDDGVVEGDPIQFDGFEIIRGGTNADDFTLEHSFTSVQGGDGDDIFRLVSGVDITNGIDGGLNSDLGTDTVIGFTGGSTVWDVGINAADNTIRVRPTTNGTNVELTNIDVLQGNTDGDTFNVWVDFAGTINGGEGADTFNILATEITTTINGEDATVGNDTLSGFDGIASTWAIEEVDSAVQVQLVNGAETITASNVEILQAGDTGDTFNVNTAFSGQILGGTDTDIFNLSATVDDGGELADGGIDGASIQGNNGADRLNVLSHDAAVDFDGGNGDSETDIVTGPSEENFWYIGTSGNASDRILRDAIIDTTDGEVVTFTNVETLQGNDDTDNFYLYDSFDGSIDGGAGADIFNVLAADLSATIAGGENTPTDNVSDTINGFSNAVTTNEWEFTGDEAGNLVVDANGSGSETITFTQIEAVNGNDTVVMDGGDEIDSDTFTDNSGGAFEETVDARGGRDIYLVNATGNYNVGFTSASLPDSDLSISNLETIRNISGSSVDFRITLLEGFNTGADFNLWDIETTADGASGTITEMDNDVVDIGSNPTALVGSNQISFENFESFTGNTRIDQFEVDGSNDIASVNGGTGENNQLTYNVGTNNSWVLSDSNYEGSIDGAVAFENFQTVVGSGTDNLTARGQTNYWSFQAVSFVLSDNLDRTGNPLTFSGFDEVTGGNNEDTYTFETDFTGTVNGGDSQDTYNIETSVSGTLDGGLGNDSFILADGGIITTSINGGDGTDDIQGRENVDEYWTIDGEYSGYVGASDNVRDIVQAFTNVETVNGRAGVDYFNLSATDSAITQIIGGGGTDWVRFDNINAAGEINVQIDDNAFVTATGDYRLTDVEWVLGDLARNVTLTYLSNDGDNIAWELNDYNDDAGDYEVDGTNDGTVGSVNFVNFDDITGGEGNDTFTFVNNDAAITTGYSITGQLDGGAGTDIIYGRDIQTNWDVTATGEGTFEVLVDDSVPDSPVYGNTVSFFDIETLYGAENANDHFELGSLILSINLFGRDGDNSVGLPSGVADITINEPVSDGIGLDGIGTISAAEATRTTNIIRFVGAQGETVDWTVDGNYSGSVGVGADTTDFVNFGILVGSAANDTYTFSDDGLVAGIYAVAASDVTDATEALVTNEINTIVGHANGSAFLISGENQQIDGATTLANVDHNGSVTGRVSGFSFINTLAGANDVVDSLTLNASGTFTGNFNGGTGIVDDVISVANDAGFDNQWTINGDTTASHTVVTTDGSDTESTITFTHVESIEGDSNVDVFNFTTTTAFNPNDTSLINGAGGSDRVDISTLDTVTLTASINGTTLTVSNSGGNLYSVENVEGFVGNNESTVTLAIVDAGSHTIQFSNVDTGVSRFTADGINDGRYGSFYFVDAARVQGGTGTTTFEILDNLIDNTLTFNGTLDGNGTAENILRWEEAGLTWRLNGADVYEGSVQNTSFDENNSLSYIDVQSLQATNSTLVGRSQINDWQISDVNAGSVELYNSANTATTFQGMSTLAGNTASDIFTFVDVNDDDIIDGEITGQIYGTYTDFSDDVSGAVDQIIVDSTSVAEIYWEITGAGVATVARGSEASHTDFAQFSMIETLTGGDGVDRFNIDATQDVTTLNGGGNTDEFDLAASIDSIIGGAGSDTFTIEEDNVTTTIDGTADDTDVLTLSHTSFAAWTISSDAGVETSNVVASNVVATGTVSFENIETLNGVDSDTAAEVDETFEITTGVTTSVTRINGRAGADTFDADAETASLVLSGGDNDDIFNLSGTLASVSGDAGSDTFNIESATTLALDTLNLSGGADDFNAADNFGDELFVAFDTAAVWSLAGGDVNTVGSVSFDGIETVRGNNGALADTFNVANATVEIIDGRDGNDQITLSSGAGVSAVYGGAGADEITTSVDVALINGGDNAGDGEGDTLTINSGFSDTINWFVTAENTGNVSGSLTITSFEGIENAVGGAGTDNFSVSANITSLVGQGGSDVFTITNENVTTTIDGTAGDTDELTLSHTSFADWTISSDAGVETSNVVAIGTVSFGNIETLNGVDSDTAAVVDETFEITTGVTTSVTRINGRAGADTFDADGNTPSLALFGGDDGDIFNLSDTVASVSGEAGSDTFNIETAATLALNTLTISGGNNTFDSNTNDFGDELFLSANVSTTWALSSVDGNSVGAVGFNGIETLRGNDDAGQQDTFNIGNTSVEIIDARAGNDNLNITGTISELIQVIGGDGTDTLTADDDANTWQLNEAESHTLNVNVEFETIENLVGNSEADSFYINSATISNLALNGVGGTDVVYAEYDASATWIIQNDDSDTPVVETNQVTVGGNTISFVGVETINGVDGSTAAITDTFNINAENDLTSIDARGGDDNFNIEASITTLEGGAGNDTFTVEDVAATVVTMNGEGDSDTLTILDADGYTQANWTIGADPSVVFINESTTEGGISNFDVEIVNGSALVDNVEISASSIGQFNAGTGNDEIAIVGTGDITMTIDGGDDADTLTAANRTNTWSLGVNTVGAPHELNSTIAFSAFETLQGNDGVDTFDVYVDTLNGIAIDGGDTDGINDVITAWFDSSAEWTIQNDTDANAINTLETVFDTDADRFTNTLTFANLETINGVDSNADGVVESFIISASNQVQTINGRAGADTFEVNANINTLNGGTGADTFDVNASITTLNGGANDDTFTIQSEAITVGEINGDGGNDTLALAYINANTTAVWALNIAQRVDFYNDYDPEGTNTAVGAVSLFTSIEDIQGSEQEDVFSVADGETVTNITAGNGADEFVMTDGDITTLNTGEGIDDIQIQGGQVQSILTGAGNDDIAIYEPAQTITSINGEDGSDELLLVTSNANTWTIDGSDTGSIAGSVQVSDFTAIENITGGEGADRFNFTTSESSISGLIDGGERAAGEDNANWTDESNDFIDLNFAANNAFTNGVIVEVEPITINGDGEIRTRLLASVPDQTLDFSNHLVLRVSNVERIDAPTADATVGTIGQTDPASEANHWIIMGNDDNVNWYFGNPDEGQPIVINNVSYTNTNDSNVAITGSEVFFNNFGSILAGNGTVNNTPEEGTHISGIYIRGTGTYSRNYTGIDGFIYVEIDERLSRVVGNGESTVIVIPESDANLNGSNLWTISGENSGTLEASWGEGDDAVEYTLVFENVNMIVGGSSADQFVFSGDGNLTGVGEVDVFESDPAATIEIGSSIDGGAGNDQITTIESTLEGGLIFGINQTQTDPIALSSFNGVSALTSSTAIYGRVDVVDITNIETLDAAGDVNVTLIGDRDAAASYTWNLNADAGGNLVGAVLDSNEQLVVSFNDLYQVIGGESIDRFNVASLGLNQNIFDGGNGNDTINFADIDSSIDVVLYSTLPNDLEAVTVATNPHVAGFEIVQLPSQDNSVAAGAELANTWSITSQNAGSVQMGAGISVQFDNAPNLIGNSRTDVFNINDVIENDIVVSSGSITGTINGGDQLQGTFDVVNVNVAGDAVYQLATLNNEGAVSNSSDAVLDVYGIETLNANEANNNTLNGLVESANTWNVAAVNNVNGMTFTGIENVVGGNQQDQFTFNGVYLDGVIDGGDNAADAVDSLVLQGNINNVSLHLGERVTTDINIINIESVTSSVDIPLVADNTINNWSISDVGYGTIGTNFEFNGFMDLVGGTANDNFSFAFAGDYVYPATIVNSISGGANPATGSSYDTVDFALWNESLVVSMDATYGGTNDLFVSNFEEVNAINGNANTLVGEADDNTWTINGNNSGDIDSVIFTGFQNLVGRGGDDSFVFTASGSVLGFVDGGEHINGDVVDVSELAEANIVISESEANGYRQIERYRAGGSNATLTAPNVRNEWLVNGAIVEMNGEEEIRWSTIQSGNETIQFTGFDTLVGGTAVDIFDVRYFEDLAMINAGSGNDEIDITIDSSTIAALEVIGGEGSLDQIDLFGGSQDIRLLGEYQIDGDNEILTFRQSENNGEANFELTFNTVESVDNNIYTSDLVINDVESNADSIVIDATNFQVNGLSEIEFGRSLDLTVQAQSDDEVTIEGNVSVASVFTVSGASVQGLNDTSIISAGSELVFDGTQLVGVSASERLRTQTPALSINNVDAAVYIDQTGDVTINALNVSDAEVNLLVDGSVSSSAALISNDLVNVEIENEGDIALTNEGNRLSGLLTFNASEGGVTLANAARTDLLEVNAQDLTINAQLNVVDSGVIRVDNETVINGSDNSNITFDTEGNDFAIVNITNANSVFINDDGEGVLSIEAPSVASLLTVVAQNDLQSNMIQAENVSLTSENGDITIESDLTADNSVALMAASGVAVNAPINVVNNQSGTAIEITANSNNEDVGVLDIAANVRASGATFGDVVLSGSDIQQAASVNVVGDLVSMSSPGSITSGTITAENRVVITGEGVDVNGIITVNNNDGANDAVAINSGAQQLNIAANIDATGLANGDVTLEGDEITQALQTIISGDDIVLIANSDNVNGLAIETASINAENSIDIDGIGINLRETLTVSNHRSGEAVNINAGVGRLTIGDDVQAQGQSASTLTFIASEISQATDAIVSGDNVVMTATGEVVANEISAVNSVDIDGLGVQLRDNVRVTSTDLVDAININAGEGALTIDGEVISQNTELGNVTLVGGTVSLGNASVVNGEDIEIQATGEITAYDVSARNVVTMRGEGITLAGQINVAANDGALAVDVDANDGALTIDNTITANGDADTAGRIALAGSGINQGSNAAIIGGEVILNSSETITVLAGIQAHRNFTATSANEFTMANATAEDVIQANDLSITSTNDMQLRTLNASNTLTLTSEQGNIIFLNDVAAQNIVVISAENGMLDQLQGTTITSNSDVDIDVNSAELNGNVTASGIIDIDSNTDVLIGGQMQSESFALVAGEQVDMLASSSVSTDTSAAITSGGDLTLSYVEATNEEGAVVLLVSGGVTDVNPEETNILSNTLDVESGTGFGESVSNRIGTSVSIVNIRNSEGTIAIQNDQALVVESMLTNGIVDLYVEQGDLTIVNDDIDAVYDRTATNALDAGGVISAGFETGNVNIIVDNGNLFGEGISNFNHPDIVGDTGYIETDGFGQDGRSIMVYFQTDLAISGPGYYPDYAFLTQPINGLDTGNSALSESSSILIGGSDLVLEVESIEEINPAVFTEVRNYSYDNISILMPRDQRYDDEEEEDYL